MTIASILHAVQEATQATSIESIGGDVSVPAEVPSNDTGLQRISSWAIKATIDRLKGDQASAQRECTH